MPFALAVLAVEPPLDVLDPVELPVPVDVPVPLELPDVVDEPVPLELPVLLEDPVPLELPVPLDAVEPPEVLVPEDVLDDDPFESPREDPRDRRPEAASVSTLALSLPLAVVVPDAVLVDASEFVAALVSAGTASVMARGAPDAAVAGAFDSALARSEDDGPPLPPQAASRKVAALVTIHTADRIRIDRSRSGDRSRSQSPGGTDAVVAVKVGAGRVDDVSMQELREAHIGNHRSQRH